MLNLDLLNKLNEEQYKAATHALGHPACLIAGAGSGKSTTLIARTAWLIAEDVTPTRLLCITFTNKAANEIRERIGIEAHDKTGPRCSTIHSLALNAIRKDPKGFGLASKITPLADYDQRALIKDIIHAMKIEGLTEWLMHEKIGYHRARGLGFAVEYTEEVHAAAKLAHGGYHSLGEQELEVWKRYEAMKKAQSVLDFDDMLHLVVRRINQDAGWKARLNKKFDTILMDEGQDTNVVQWAFVNGLLAPGNRDLFMVGDGSQSIYGFAGASPEIFFKYTQEWRGITPALYKLESNYRSVPEVVNLANLIQKKMTETVPLKMKSIRGNNGDKGSTKLVKGTSLEGGAATARDIASGIASQIASEVARKRGGNTYRDYAILVRAGSAIRDIEPELVKNRIPYIIRGGAGFIQSEEVQDMLAYMKLIVNPKDVRAFTRAIGVPKRSIGPATIDKMYEVAERHFDGDMIQGGLKHGLPKAEMFLRFLEGVANSNAQASKVLHDIIKFTKYHSIIEEKYKKDADKVEMKKQNLVRLAELFLSLEETSPDITMEDVVFQLSMNERGEDKTEEGKVVISTIHAAKGLEYKNVWVFSLNEGILPHRWSQGSEREIEEERRLLYVACTRAKDSLYLVLPSLVQYGPNVQQVKPSRFLYELGIL